MYIGRLQRGDDLLEAITALCRREKVHLGRIEALGAVERARLAFYDQQARKYRYFVLERPLEITKLTGNVSLKDGEPFVHAHVTLSDSDGSSYGGHLAQGTTVFACEVILQAFHGVSLERAFDESTGLSLWRLEK
jgi:hypothetical protein